MSRIYLSSPHMGSQEFRFVEEAFATNWIAPVGPHMNAFEHEFVALTECGHAAALSSGTAALHLALHMSEVGPGDEVICSTLTFVASANPILQLGATPVFIDSDERSWNMDPHLLRETLVSKAAAGKLPKAVVLVHLYGQSADLDPILEACEKFDVPLIEDAAEALGATYFTNRLIGEKAEKLKTKKLKSELAQSIPEVGGNADGARERVEGAPVRVCPGGGTRAGALWANEEQTLNAKKLKSEVDRGVKVREDGAPEGKRAVMPGTLGQMGIYSFNGNKIITTSGGGMLVSRDSSWADRARFLATQARDPAPHYEHTQAGFNYRMSNVLAGIGRGQLQVLADRVNARRRVFSRYESEFADLPGVTFMPEADFGRSTRWLSCLTINPLESGGVTRETVRLAMEKEDIEARPIWKPMHQQPLFKRTETVGGEVSDRLFEQGLCLPSGSNLSDAQIDRVIACFRSQWSHPQL